MDTHSNNQTKICVLCFVSKPITDFYVAKGYKDGLSKRCKQCNRQKAYAWRKEHPEAWKAYSREYRRRYRAQGRDSWLNKKHMEVHGIPFTPALANSISDERPANSIGLAEQPGTSRSWSELRARTETAGGIETYPMRELRNLLGAKKIGRYVRLAIARELARVGLAAHGPQGPLPVHQDDLVRVFVSGSAVGRLIEAAKAPGTIHDETLRVAACADRWDQPAA